MHGKFILVSAIALTVVFLLSRIIDRWMNPWLAKRLADKILLEIKDGKPPTPRDYSLEICFDANGIQLSSLKQTSDKPIFISWQEISLVTAFKRDLYTVDCICLLVKTSDAKALELNEDMKGWPELIESIEKYLPGSKPLSEWIFQVGSPAFELNPTQIFARL